MNFLRKNWRLLTASAIAFLSTALLRIAACAGAENCHDVFYHVRVAREGWSVFAAKAFPATTLSLWSDTFADKELLYHVLLSWTDKVRAALGFADFPFHFQALFFLALLVAAFAWCARSLKLKNDWLAVLLLFGVCHVFTQRMLLLRPHVFAVTLMLCCTALYLRDWKRWTFLIAFGTGFLFAWSYSNPHFLYLAAGSFTVGRFVNGERKDALLLLGGATAGLLAGYTIHPQCPNTFVTWLVQCVVVPRIMMQKETLVGLGDEAALSGIVFYQQMLPLFALFVFNLGLTAFGVWKKRDVMRKTEIIAFGMMAIATALGTLKALRVVEYSPIFNLLYCLLLVENFGWRIFPSHRAAWNIGKTAAAAALLVYSLSQLYPTPSRVEPFRKTADYIRKTLKPGLTIGNLSWSCFPRLYYLLPDYKFLCGLDPTFGLAAAPERYAKIEAMRRCVLDKPFTPAEMTEIIGTPLLFVSSEKFGRYLYWNGYRNILFHSDEGYLFYLGAGKEEK